MPSRQGRSWLAWLARPGLRLLLARVSCSVLLRSSRKNGKFILAFGASGLGMVGFGLWLRETGGFCRGVGGFGGELSDLGGWGLGVG